MNIQVNLNGGNIHTIEQLRK